MLGPVVRGVTSTSTIVTTKIDSLALQGTIVEKAYTHTSVISPSNIVLDLMHVL